jgi:hypothetical protein
MSAEIVAYATSKGTIQPDSPATASVRLTNTGPKIVRSGSATASRTL